MNRAEAATRVENAEAPATAWRFAAGAETGGRRHQYDHVVVPSTDECRASSPPKANPSPSRTRAAYFRRAGVEHNAINAGDPSLAFVEIGLVKHPQ